MERRATGLGFCAIAAFLYAAKYIAAAIYGSGQTTWSGELFHGLLSYVGTGLTISSVLALIVGIVYLIASEIRR